MKKQYSIIVLLLIAFGIGGYVLGKASGGSEGVENSIRQSGYSYINPLLECENNGSFAKQKYIPFENSVKKRIGEFIEKNHSGTTYAVYFRNLNNGPWFGIAEDTKFVPASLMKVTLFISYIKWIEEDPLLLGKKFILSEANTLNQLIPPEKTLIPGNEYTVGELLYSMIVYSDNGASFTLLKNIPPERQTKTFIDLGVRPPDITKKDYDISVKEYASFFRILYNSSYLSNNGSEKALEILAQSGFKDGIVKPIPPEIRVAHKFGEREYMNESGQVLSQLHDCGIIYHPNYPYLLCVMTRSTEGINALSHTIQGVSQIVFDEINLRHPYK